MSGSIAADVVFALVTTISVVLALEYHWAFLLIPLIFILGLILIIFKERAVLVIMVGLLPVGIPAFNIGLACFYPSDIFFAILVLFWLSQPASFFGKDVPNMSFFSGLLAAILLSLVVNIHNYSAQTIASAVFYVVIFVKFMLVYRYGFMKGLAGQEDLLVRALYAGSWVTIIVASYQVFVQKLPLAIAYGAWGLIGGHHSGLGTFLIIPTTIAISRIFRNKETRILDVFSLLFSVYGILLAQSRSSLIALSVALPILFIREVAERGRGRLKVVVVIALGMAALAFMFGETVYERTFKLRGGLDMSSFSRIFIWQGVIQSYLDYPLYRKLFGCGVAAFADNHSLPFNLWGSMKTSGGHNQYLHVLLETGIVGLLAFLALWFRMFLGLFKRMRAKPALLSTWLTLLALLLGGLVQENLWMNIWHGETVMAFLLFAGLYFGVSEDYEAGVLRQPETALAPGQI